MIHAVVISASAASEQAAPIRTNTNPVSTPGARAYPNCVKVFNGVNFDGWEADPSTWSIVDNAMRGVGGTSRLAYTKADYGSFRLIFTARMNPVNGDHLGVLFWGDRPTDPAKPKIDNAGWIQFMPPFAGMWDYHPPQHHNLPHEKVAEGSKDSTQWCTTELLCNLEKGTMRAAVDGVELARYVHPYPSERTDPERRIVPGPIGLFRHGGGASEYKDVYVEANPDSEVLITVKPAASSNPVRGKESTGLRELRWTKRNLFVGPYENCTVADLNQDGRVDIVYGPYWFAGPDFVPRAYRPNHLSPGYHHNNSDHVFDLDRDGWPDIIAGGWETNGIYWYRNPGNKATEAGRGWEMHAAWEAHQLSATRGRMEMFVAHDYDGDGIPELHAVCYGREEPLEVFRLVKNPAGNPAMKSFILGAEGGGHGVAFGDVNGDGREDVLCEIGWYERPAGDPFKNPWQLHRETDLPKMHPSCPFVVKDLNGDGLLDILFGRAHDYGLYWWEQLAPKSDGTTQWQQHVIDESWSQAHCLALADLDGDGQDELIAGKCIWAHNGGDRGAADPPAVYYYSWDSKTRHFTRHTIAAPGEGIALGRQIAVADVDGDGRPDLLLPSKHSFWVLYNRGLL